MTTLERFHHRRNENLTFLSKVESLVIDEFDTFLDGGKGEELDKITQQFLGKSADKMNDKRQVVFSTATVTKAMDKFI